MSAALDTFIEHAKKLNPEEMVIALDVLQEMLSPPDQAWHDAWASEAEDRIQALEQGELETLGFDDVIEMIKQDIAG